MKKHSFSSSSSCLKKFSEKERKKILEEYDIYECNKEFFQKQQEEIISIRKSRENIGCSCKLSKYTYVCCQNKKCTCFKNNLECHEDTCDCIYQNVCKNPKQYTFNFEKVNQYRKKKLQKLNYSSKKKIK